MGNVIAAPPRKGGWSKVEEGGAIRAAPPPPPSRREVGVEHGTGACREGGADTPDSLHLAAYPSPIYGPTIPPAAGPAQTELSMLDPRLAAVPVCPEGEADSIPSLRRS